jgi:acyl-CoA synthetase (NDP forming)
MPTIYPEAARYGALLRQVREQQRAGLKAIAGKAGISFQHLARIEKGEINTPVGMLARVAEALGLSLPALFGAPSPLIATHCAHALTKLADGLQDVAAVSQLAGVPVPDVVPLKGLMEDHSGIFPSGKFSSPCIPASFLALTFPPSAVLCAGLA